MTHDAKHDGSGGARGPETHSLVVSCVFSVAFEQAFDKWAPQHSVSPTAALHPFISDQALRKK